MPAGEETWHVLLHPNTFTIVPVKMDKEECKMGDKKREEGHSRMQMFDLLVTIICGFCLAVVSNIINMTNTY